MKGFLSVSLLCSVLLAILVPECYGQFGGSFFFRTTKRFLRPTTTTQRPTTTTQRPTTTTQRSTTATTTQPPTTTTTPRPTTARPTTARPTTKAAPALKLAAAGGQAVGFTAGLLGQKRGLSKGDTIFFNDVITNEGNDFDRRKGTFTCEVPGLYLFSLSITAFERHPITMQLGVNGEKKMDVVVGSGLVSSSSSGSVVLRLKQGDEVRVTNANFIGHKIEALGTTFSGVLIQAM